MHRQRNESFVMPVLSSASPIYDLPYLTNDVAVRRWTHLAIRHVIQHIHHKIGTFHPKFRKPGSMGTDYPEFGKVSGHLLSEFLSPLSTGAASSRLLSVFLDFCRCSSHVGAVGPVGSAKCNAFQQRSVTQTQRLAEVSPKHGCRSKRWRRT
jgi:hypothetical protein